MFNIPGINGDLCWSLLPLLWTSQVMLHRALHNQMAEHFSWHSYQWMFLFANQLAEWTCLFLHCLPLPSYLSTWLLWALCELYAVYCKCIISDLWRRGQFHASSFQFFSEFHDNCEAVEIHGHRQYGREPLRCRSLGKITRVLLDIEHHL